jgi:hypothetical protein
MNTRTLVYWVVGVVVALEAGKRVVAGLIKNKIVESLDSSDPRVERAAKAGADAFVAKLGTVGLVQLAIDRLGSGATPCPPGCRPT